MAKPANAPRSYMPAIEISVVKDVKTGKGTRPVINLALNESSYGASPEATKAALDRAERLHRYPDPASTSLRQAIGKAHGFDPDQLVCGNGSEELLDVIGRLFARPGDEIVFAECGFLQFPIVTRRVGATAVKVPERDLVADVDELLGGITERTRIVFIGNPDNPLGTYIPKSELARLAENVPDDVVLVIDSAYAEYAYGVDDFTAGHEFVEGRENVVVTRTFSKAYGLAALRVGWAHGSKTIIGAMNQMRGIGNVNAIAQAATTAALEDQDFVLDVVKKTAAERARMTEALGALGLACLPGVGNFIMVKFPSDTNHRASAAFAFLAEHRIIVRGVEDYGLDDYLRITLGLPEENDAVIDCMKRFMV